MVLVGPLHPSDGLLCLASLYPSPRAHTLFTRQVKVVDWISSSILVGVCRAARHRIDGEETPYRRHIAPHPHLDHSRRKFRPPQLPSQPTEPRRFFLRRVAELVEAEGGGRFGRGL